MVKINKNKKIKTKRFVLKRFYLSASIGGYEAGTTISLECHKKEGTPRERYWRKRLIEAEIDGCIVEVAVPKTKKASADTPSTD